MSKNVIKLSAKEREYLTKVLEYERNSETTKRKVKVILLRNQGKSIPFIINETNLSKRTIINYTNQYLKNPRFFAKTNYKKSELSKHQEIINEFRERPPKTYKEATERIEKLFGITRSVTQVRKFLNKKRIFTIRTKNMLYIERQKLRSKLGSY